MVPRMFMAHRLSNPLRILHIDDDPQWHQLTQGFLQEERYSFDYKPSTNPEEALSRVDSEVDCVVVDQQMPELSGIQILDTLRANHPSLPLIFFTHHHNKEFVQKVLNMGATDCIQKSGKPAVFNRLQTRIEDAATRYRFEDWMPKRAQEPEKSIKNDSDILFSVTSDGTIDYVQGDALNALDISEEELIDREIDSVINRETEDDTTKSSPSSIPEFYTTSGTVAGKFILLKRYPLSETDVGNGEIYIGFFNPEGQRGESESN
jgi:DNA-binding response OmpR family regulator